MTRRHAYAALLVSLAGCGPDSYSEAGRLQEFPSVESDGNAASGGTGAAGDAGETFGGAAGSSDGAQAGGSGGSED